MPYFKIKSLTHTLPKRHDYKDKILNIKYQTGFIDKVYKLPAGGEMVYSGRKLPVELHILRAKKFIVVTEIDEIQYNKLQKPSAKPVPVKQQVAVEAKQEVEQEPTTTTTKKPRGRKSTKKEEIKDENS